MLIRRKRLKDICQNKLPDTIYQYKKAGLEDIDELVRTRIIVLRAANQLENGLDMSRVEKE